MLNLKIVVLLVIVGLLFLKSQGGVRENMGSAFFHRGKLADINQNIQAQVLKARSYYNNDEDVKEEFSILGNDLDETYGDDLKKSMKDQPIQAFDPSRNVISEYSFKALKPTEQALDDIQIGDLESADFAKPFDYSAHKPLSEYLEVDSYNSGSGDISDLKEAYKMVNKEQYFQTLKALRVRGGNVHLYKTKPCKPYGGGDIIGFL